MATQKIFGPEADAWALDRGIATDASLGALSDRVDVTETDIAALEAADGTLGGRVTATEADIATLEGQNLNSRLTTAEGGLSTANSNIATHETRLDNAEARIVSTDIDLEIDEGCTPASGASPVDNYSLLAPIFGADNGKTRIKINFAGNIYATSQKINVHPFAGLEVDGGAGPSSSFDALHFGFTQPTQPQYETAGPAGGLVKIGTAGETLLQINGSLQCWRRVLFLGKYAHNNGNSIQNNIAFANGAGICVLFNQGDTNLQTSPKINNPGKQGFYDCSFGSASVGTCFGTAYTGNHADESVFVNCNWTWCEDALWSRCKNSIGFTFMHPRFISCKRRLRMDGGGQFTFIGARMGSGAFGVLGVSTLMEPVLLHVGNAAVNEGDVVLINDGMDGTLSTACLHNQVNTAASSTSFTGLSSESPNLTTLSASDDAYNGRRLYFITGSLAGESQLITDYTGSTRTFTTAAFTGTPSPGDQFQIGSFRIVDWGDIAQGSGVKDSAFFPHTAPSGASNFMLKLIIQGMLNPAGVYSQPMFRFRGPSVADITGLYGLRDRVFEFAHINAAEWGTLGPTDCGPNVNLYGATFCEDCDPGADSIFGSSSQEYCVKWYGARHNYGAPIADSYIDEFGVLP